MKSTGHLYYSSGPKLIVEVDEGLSRFYRSLVPRYVRLQPQRWLPHITVIRNEPVSSDRWALRQGELIEFNYNVDVKNDSTYYWLNVWSDVLTCLRLELGLPPSSEWSRPPDGADCFHITLGNTKHVENPQRG